MPDCDALNDVQPCGCAFKKTNSGKVVNRHDLGGSSSLPLLPPSPSFCSHLLCFSVLPLRCALPDAWRLGQLRRLYCVVSPASFCSPRVWFEGRPGKCPSHRSLRLHRTYAGPQRYRRLQTSARYAPVYTHTSTSNRGGIVRFLRNLYEYALRKRWRTLLISGIKSITAAVLNAKSAIDLDHSPDIGIPICPTIRGVSIGSAWSDSIALIHPELQSPQTTFSSNSAPLLQM